VVLKQDSNKMFIAKLHEKQDRKVLAVIDSDLLGKCFTEGRKQLDLNSEFYNGKEMSKEEFNDLLPACDMLNLAGKEIISLAKELGLVEDEDIITIDNISHTQCVVLR